MQGRVFHVLQWYGAVQMTGDCRAAKLEDLAVIYIVSCCIRAGRQMIRVSSFVWCLVVATTLLVWPLAAFAQSKTMSVHLSYKVSLGHVDVATTSADWVFGEDTFELSATSRTVGLTDMLRKYRGQIDLSGRIENGLYLPQNLSIGGVSKRRTRQALTTWAPDTDSVVTKRDPELDLEKVFPLSDKHIDGAIDPFSAMLNALNNVAQDGSCAGSERVYDGLRTSEFELHNLGTQILEKDRPFAFAGKTSVCGFVSKATGGHQRKSRWRKQQPAPEDVLIFVAEVRPDLFLPVRMEAKSFIGTVTVRLVMPTLAFEIH